MQITFAGIDWNQVANKFAKAAIFGAGAALFSVNVQSFSLNSLQGYQKLALAIGTAIVTGVLHAVWNLGEQMFTGGDLPPAQPLQPTA